MCFNAFDKAADLDVLDHPVLNFIYYLVCFGFCMQCNCMVRYQVTFFGHVLRIKYSVCRGCLVYFFVSPFSLFKGCIPFVQCSVFALWWEIFVFCVDEGDVAYDLTCWFIMLLCIEIFVYLCRCIFCLNILHASVFILNVHTMSPTLPLFAVGGDTTFYVGPFHFEEVASQTWYHSISSYTVTGLEILDRHRQRHI